jgi:hypothetical protein
MDGGLTAVVLDPHFPGLGARELPQPGNPAHLPAAYLHHPASRARLDLFTRFASPDRRRAVIEGEAAEDMASTSLA